MAEFTEKQVYEAFGLGAQGQEVAAPAAEPPTAEPEAPAQADAGAQGQEVAAPAAESADTPAGETEPTAADAESETADTDADTDAGTEKQPQTPEQRRANAARRRQQEQQAAIDQAVAAEREKQEAFMQTFFAEAGLKNTFTGQPITNKEDFDAGKKQFAENKLQQDLKAGKLTPEDIHKVVSEHPVVKQAGEAISRAETERQQAQAEAFRTKVAGELAEIQKLDPTIKTVEDLLKMPNAQEFYGYVKNGASFLKAFRMANEERLTAAKVEAARQQAISNTRSKAHLTATGNSRGGGAASVPTDELAVFRMFLPGASEAEIQAYYNNYHKKK